MWKKIWQLSADFEQKAAWKSGKEVDRLPDFIPV
jgi:hypothetical protein